MKNSWKLRLNSYLDLFLIVLITLSSAAYAGENPYLFPIRPGQQNYLAGTMGEVRGAHFHGGIDIKTGGTTGYEVQAAADGFVSRIKTEGNGYGNAIYIEHPQLGTTTVYGHLERFNGNLAEYTLKEQYNRRSFAVDLYPDKALFRVKKGDLIAYSGNSGGSSGPHLHFEIRDSRQRPINPLLLGFKEIKDNQSPTVQKIAMKTMDMDSRIQNQFGWFEFTPSGLRNEYMITNPIEVYGEIGFMLMGYDRLNDVPNKNGIPFMSATLDDIPIIDIQIEKVPFEDNRQVLCFKDYQVLSTENKTYQKLFIDDGNNLDIYKKHLKRGIISIRDTLIHRYEVTLKDANGNKTVLKLKLKGSPPTEKSIASNKSFKPFRFQVQDNTLVLMDKKNSDTGKAKVYADRRITEIKSSYFVGDYGVFLWDMRKGIPDSVVMSNGTIYPEMEMVVPAGSDFKYYKDAFNLHFYTRTLFDTLYLKTDYIDELTAGREFFEVSEDIYPLNANLKITLMPRLDYKNKDKISAYYTSDLKNFSYQGGEWLDNTFEFKTRTLGKYTLLADTVPPKVRIIQQNLDSFRCSITDALSGIKDFNLYVDGKWVLTWYDPKNDVIWSEKLDKKKPFKGNLELKVRDNVNNETVYTTVIQ